MTRILTREAPRALRANQAVSILHPGQVLPASCFVSITEFQSVVFFFSLTVWRYNLQNLKFK
jgi:hypothetical protein